MNGMWPQRPQYTTHTHTHTHTRSQTDTHTHSVIDRQTHRHTDRHTHTHSSGGFVRVASFKNSWLALIDIISLPYPEACGGLRCTWLAGDSLASAARHSHMEPILA